MYKPFNKHEDARELGLFIPKNQIEAMNAVKLKWKVLLTRYRFSKLPLMLALKLTTDLKY